LTDGILFGSEGNGRTDALCGDAVSQLIDVSVVGEDWLGATCECIRKIMHPAGWHRREHIIIHSRGKLGEPRIELPEPLAAGQAVGWFQGAMEFGPRAVGARSILGDPRSPTMQKALNLKVKYRESFRPFAPSVLREDVASWFELDVDSPYMLLVAAVKPSRQRPMREAERALFGIDKLNVPRSEIPAVTHVDYSARVQTVHADTNPRYHALISRFKALTSCPVLVNTSFNVRGEPIVCTPEDAFRCFMGTEIELLVVGNCVLRKDEQDQGLKFDYKDAFELD
jgi:carbamoyltransferase